ncbi:ABC transporter permease [Cohnella fermenti]|uniref:ABC transporter permease n=1 Tax=Cohnella fermenti TaxID=2565925 RepID=A0A4S4BJG8_9BACL|nr:ABC transporter permease [Cohnella fermenti]THF74714.1 ABC transporter permease [Cohnella fermenti]
MANFWNLVQNENMKIYRRIRAWIMLGFVALAPIAISIIYIIASGEFDANNWEMMTLETTILYQLITIFTVVKAADSVAGEFSTGTIKLLLIRPWSRSMILLSKFVALLLFAVVQMVLLFVVTWGINALLFGVNSDASGIIPSGSPLAGHSVWGYVGLMYLYLFIAQLMIIAVAFMLSSAFRSGGLAIGLSIFVLFSGSIITGLLSLTDKAWVKYVLFANIDVTSYLNGSTPLPNQDMTLGFSLAVLAGYFIVLNLISWLVFVKRDVAA